MKLALVTALVLASGGVAYAGFCMFCPWWERTQEPLRPGSAGLIFRRQSVVQTSKWGTTRVRAAVRPWISRKSTASASPLRELIYLLDRHSLKMPHDPSALLLYGSGRLG